MPIEIINHTLTLSNLSDQNISVLETSLDNPSSIKTIELIDINLNYINLEILFNFVEQFINLKSLELLYAHFGYQKVNILCNYLSKFKSLESLDLHCNDITLDGIPYLAEYLKEKDCSLVDLYITNLYRKLANKIISFENIFQGLI